MYARQGLPKLYHLGSVDDNAVAKQEEKMKTRKLSPVSVVKPISTNENKTSGAAADSKPNDEADAVRDHSSPDHQATAAKSESKSTSSQSAPGSPTSTPNEIARNETQPAECKTNEIDLHPDERMSDPEAEARSDDKVEPENGSKEDSRDGSFEKDCNYDKEPEAGAPFGSGKRPVQLNMDGLLEVINELKSNRSRVTKISVEKCFQRRNTSLSKNEITEYVNRCIDQDAFSNLDNLSECSLNVNALNEDLEEVADGSGYNTKKSSLKRCTPTIRYMLRTAPEDGVSAADMLKSLQNKRILILYDLRKFVWLMRTYFVDKGIAELLSNGNYRALSNDEENSNTSAIKCQSGAELLKANKEDEEIDLLADEKFSDNENFETSTASNSDDKQSDAGKDPQTERDELVKKVNQTSNYLTVELVNKAIDEIAQTHKSFDLENILRLCGVVGLGETELAAFLLRCIKSGLLKKKDPMYGEMIMDSIKKSQVLDKLELPNNNSKLLSEINDETSNTSVQSASNDSKMFVGVDYMDFDVNDSLSLKRKLKANDKLLGKSLDDSALRRPISQRKKIKKSLGPDFLDPSGVRYQQLKSSYEDKCEICLKNSDKTMVNCRKCKFKAHRLCLSTIDLMFRRGTKKFECETCRVKCRVCKEESEALMSSLITCKRCNISYHSKCLLIMTDKVVKGCPTCEKTYLKYSMNKDDEKLAEVNGGSSKDSSEKHTGNLEIDEASSSDINVQPNYLEEVPTLTQLKEIKMTDNDLNQARAEERVASVDREPESSVKDEPLSNLNDGANEDSNLGNAGASSSASSSSNAENASLKRAEPEESLLQKYRKLFKAYDVHQQVKITKEQFNTLKSLNSYSNGKSPVDWSVDDVADFIASIGFPDESLIFRQEEVDGKSLLLLRRNDVLTGLSMRLGPALKVYSYIYRLQASV